MTTYINPNVSIESHDGVLTIVLHPRYAKFDRETAQYEGGITIHLGAYEQLDLLGELSRQSAYSITGLLHDIGLGPCERCRNHRLINIENRGRTTNQYCPDCNPGGRGEDRQRIVASMSPSNIGRGGERVMAGDVVQGSEP